MAQDTKTANKSKKATSTQRPAKRRIVEVYNYWDENRSELLYQTVRYEPKDFKQRRPNPKNPPDPDPKKWLNPNNLADRQHWIWNLEGVRLVLYRLPDILDSVNLARPAYVKSGLYVVEGEKDVDHLWSIGIPATTNPMGAGKWRHEYSNFLTAWPKITILLDNDKPGKDHAKFVGESLLVAGILDVRCVVELPGLPEHGDVSDWLDQGHIKEELIELADQETPIILAGQEPTIKFWSNDEYNAKRLIQLHGDVLRYCWGVGWLTYDGQRWNRKEGVAMAENLARQTAESLFDVYKKEKNPDSRTKILKWFENSQNYRQIQAMLNMARSDDKIRTLPERLDSDIYLFNCDNGTLNLRNGELRPHRSQDMITQLAPVKYDHEAISPHWLKCLAMWMQDDRASATPNARAEKIDYLQRLMGMCLTGDICARVFPIFHGSGRNGKSVFLDTIRELMGDYAFTAPEELLMEKQYQVHPCEIAALVGKRLVTLDETKPNMKLRTPLVKRMTGDRTLQARYMRENYFEFHTTNKTILVTQNLPRITETTDAIWDRVQLLSWAYRITDKEQDSYLIDHLRSEWPGILNWLIEGCLKWQKDQGKLLPPTCVQTATENYREESDILTNFIDEMLIKDAGESTLRKSDLHKGYTDWAKSNEVKYPVSERELNEYIRTHCVVKEGSIWKDKKAVKVWFGIGLRKKE